VAERIVSPKESPAVSTSRPSTRSTPIWLTVLLGVLGIACVVVGIVYFAEPAHSLPSFFPGHTAHGTKSRTKHGIAAVVVGVLFLIGAWVTSGRKRSAHTT
jgi:uncharacterized membrane protein HdeD (DUF308 family)